MTYSIVNIQFSGIHHLRQYSSVVDMKELQCFVFVPSNGYATLLSEGDVLRVDAAHLLAGTQAPFCERVHTHTVSACAHTVRADAHRRNVQL